MIHLPAALVVEALDLAAVKDWYQSKPLQERAHSLGRYPIQLCRVV
jgi:hypothetical protein